MEDFKSENIKKYWKNQCYKMVNNIKFADPDFPPNENSLLGKNLNGEWIDINHENSSSINSAQTEWKSASEIFSNFSLFEDKIECNDIKQGNLGNCYFLSTLAALSEFPEFIYKIFKTKEVNKEGYYEVCFFIDGEWQIVTVDDFFPVQRGTNKLLFARPNGRELWVILLEKVWAKINGGYANTIAGWPSDPLSTLTGFPTQKIIHKDYTIIELWDILLQSDRKDNVMCTSTKNDNTLEQAGLVNNHAYTLIGAKEYHGNEIIRLIHIRNPWGHKEWKLRYSDKSSEWTEELKNFFGHSDKDDGTFFMCLEDFVNFFQITHICEIMPDSYVKVLRKNEFSSPFVFNLHIQQNSKIAISALKNHWRFNRSLKNKHHPIFLVIGKYESFNISKIDGKFCSSDSVEYVKDLDIGDYVIWIFYNQQASDIPKLEFLNIRFMSNCKFIMNEKISDSNYDLINHLIKCGVMEKYAEEISKHDNFDKIDNSFDRTGIGYRFSMIKYQNKYQLWMNDITEIQNMSILTKYPIENNKLKFIVPPKGSNILIGLRNMEYGTFWFNVKSGYKNMDYKEGSESIFPPNIDLRIYLEFISINSNNYTFDYMTFHLDKKIERVFNSNKDESQLNQLIKNHPNLMETILKIPKLELNQKLSWSYLKFQNGYYVGELNENRLRHGRGAYYWNSGVLYLGYWMNNVSEKYGNMFINNKLIYEGEFYMGKKHGKGVLYLNTGDKYEGTFVEDRREGKGTYIWKCGSRWEGFFINGTLHGKGMYYPGDNENCFECEYRNGILI